MTTGTITPAQQAARNRLQALNDTPADRSERAARQRIEAQNAAGIGPYIPLYQTVPGAYDVAGNPIRSVNTGAITQSQVSNINQIAGQQLAQRAQTQRTPVIPKRTTTSSGGGRSGGGGGGGGGLPVFNQAQLDWAAQLMNAARPGSLTANNLDLPDYAGMALRPFDATLYNQARTAWNQGVEQDLGTANQATQNMLNFLNSNYRNAFNNPLQGMATMSQAPGMDQAAMVRLLQSQGLSPSLAAPGQQEGLQADQAMRNVWAMLAANEDLAQRNRLANAQQYGTQATQGITAAGRAGNLGIDLGQGAAQQAWQQRADERAYQDYQMQQQILQQEALQNWTRANQVQDTNYSTINSYNNSVLSSLLGLLPSMSANPGLVYPSMAALGLGTNTATTGPVGPAYAPGGNAQDPLGWAYIAQSLGNAGDPAYAAYRTV